MFQLWNKQLIQFCWTVRTCFNQYAVCLNSLANVLTEVQFSSTTSSCKEWLQLVLINNPTVFALAKEVLVSSFFSATSCTTDMIT